MDALEAMHGRRSIRHYADRPVDDEAVTVLLRAAMSAPTAGNQQSWRFVVVRDRATLRRLSDTTPYGNMLPGAALAIAVCGELAAEKHVGYWVQDCAAAMQNLLVAAHAMGLGAVWLGFHPVEERVQGAARVLGLPEGVRVLGVASVGHPAEDKRPVDRFDPAKVHLERWGDTLR